ncbi:MAG: SIMPL domain-containing protein [Candidatus Fibromonas sp.]|jgi:uncharacterized protein YggE|nr:SIMPL domain-containing protein [Candidatus Fibromonas sp.]
MNKNESQCIISVKGYGYTETETNIMRISIGVSRIAETIKQAQKEVNIIMNKLMDTLKSYKISEKDIHTTSLDFGPHSEYEKDKYVYKGQKVSQSMLVFIDDLEKNIEKAIQILDDFANNDSISVDIYFETKGDKERSLKCRELAYLDAWEKAKRYADLANLKIIKAIKINENRPSENYRSYDYDDDIVCEAPVVHNDKTNISLGKTGISKTLYVDFLAE